LGRLTEKQILHSSLAPEQTNSALKTKQDVLFSDDDVSGAVTKKTNGGVV
jgi:hypothetical protein